MFVNHTLGGVIRHLRAMRVAGASVPELATYLVGICLADDMGRNMYMCRAFCDFKLTFLERGARNLDSPEGQQKMEQFGAPIIDANREKWQTQRFPELLRHRDYFAFLQFARDEQLIVTVCGANPYAGQFVNRPRFRCYDGSLFVISRETPPNEGLIAADPGDRRLQEALQSYAPPLAYGEYIQRLESQRLRVLGEADGYVIEDQQGNRFYEGYRLHGVID